MDNKVEDEIFVIKARRCKRCGGLLTSVQGVKDGYGHTCKKKAEEEQRQKEFEKMQISLFD